MERLGDWPGEKFEGAGSRASGIRSPLVSTATEAVLFTGTSATRLQGRRLAGKVMLCVSSNFRPSLLRGGFTGMNVRRASTARGAEKFPPPSFVRKMLIVVTRCWPPKET